MAKEKKEVEEEAKPVEPKKKSILKWIIILSVVLAIIIAGTISGFYFFTKTENKKTAVEKTVVLTVWPMDAFIINIAETNGERYLKIVMQLEVSDPSVIIELEQLKPRLQIGRAHV